MNVRVKQMTLSFAATKEASRMASGTAMANYPTVMALNTQEASMKVTIMVTAYL